MSKKIIVLQAMPGNYDRPLEEQKSMLKSMREDIDKTGIVIIPKGFTYSIKEIDDAKDSNTLRPRKLRPRNTMGDVMITPLTIPTATENAIDGFELYEETKKRGNGK